MEMILGIILLLLVTILCFLSFKSGEESGDAKGYERCLSHKKKEWNVSK